MKKAYILIFTFLFSVPLYSQFEWVGDHGYSSKLGGLLKTKDNRYILTRQAQDDAGFIVLDSTGNLIYDYSDEFNLNGSFCGTSFVDQGFLRVFESIGLPDSSFTLITHFIRCSESQYYAGGCLGVQRFDTDWNESTFLPCLDPDFGPGNRWIKGAVFSDGSLILIEDRYHIGRGSLQEEYIWVVNTNMLKLNDVTTSPSDTAFIASGGGVIVMDINGNIDTTHEEYILSQLETTPDGNLLGSKNDSVYLFSPKMEVLYSQQFGGDEVIHFYMDPERIGVLTSSAHVYTLDQDLSILNDFPVPDGYAPDFIALDHDGVLLAGTECYGNDNQNENTCAPYLKKFQLDGTAPEWSKDVGVTSIEETTLPTGMNIPNSDYKLIYDGLKITVHNFGDEPIDSLKLNAYFPSLFVGFFCEKYYQYYHRKFTGLSLAPGESIDIFWDNFQILFTQKPTAPFDICIWTSLPGQRLDSDNTNDRFCADFVVQGEEQIKQAGNMKVYPNPSFSGSTVEYSFQNPQGGHARIFNSMGALVGSYELQQGHGTLALPRYGAGLYYVVLEVEGQVVETEKLVQL